MTRSDKELSDLANRLAEEFMEKIMAEEANLPLIAVVGEIMISIALGAGLLAAPAQKREVGLQKGLVIVNQHLESSIRRILEG